LGHDFIPRTAEDVEAIRSVFDSCEDVAVAGSYLTCDLKPYGPDDNLDGMKYRVYRGYFLSPDGRGPSQSSASLLGELQSISQREIALSARAANTRASIIQIEQALDVGNFVEADRLFSKLSEDKLVLLPETTKYLAESANLRTDLAAYSQAASMHALIDASPIAHILELAAEESNANNAATNPLTVTSLHTYVAEDKATLRKQLGSLPQFETSVKAFTEKSSPSGSTQHSNAQYDDAKRDLEQLRLDLNTSHELAELTSNQSAMRLIRSWYGDELADSLIQKTAGLKAAWENETKLSVYVEAVQAERVQEEAQRSARLEAIQHTRDQQEARQRALIEERNSLAGTIWNKVLYITMLDEKFNLTEKMGYTMEADKQRTALNSLLRQDRAMLTPSLWSEVNQEYQRILPGLTVWQASHARSMIAGLHSFSR